MIKSVGQNMSAAIEASRLQGGAKTRATSEKGSVATSSSSSASSTPAGRMAAEGAPVDLDRVAAIKAAIASGNYPVDAAAIANKMLELDLPANG